LSREVEHSRTIALELEAQLEAERQQRQKEHIEAAKNLQSHLDHNEKMKLKELEAINERVRLTVEKKDALIHQLREQCQAKELRIQSTELLLQQQRQDLLNQLHI
jgi:hypothetical protein